MYYSNLGLSYHKFIYLNVPESRSESGMDIVRNTPPIKINNFDLSKNPPVLLNIDGLSDVIYTIAEGVYSNEIDRVEVDAAFDRKKDKLQVKNFVVKAIDDLKSQVKVNKAKGEPNDL